MITKPAKSEGYFVNHVIPQLENLTMTHNESTKLSTTSINQQIHKAEQEAYLKKPKPPSAEAVARAAFVDKTYVFKGQSNARL